MAFDEFMANADALLAKLQALQDASKLSAGTTTAASSAAGGIDGRAIAEELERLYQNGARNYSWMPRR